MPTTKKEFERRVAALEREVAVLRAQNGQFEAAVTAVGRLIESHSELLLRAASVRDTVISTRSIQVVDKDGRVAIQLATGPNGEPLVHLVHRAPDGDIRHVDENVLFPPATNKGVNDG